jgi:hypothetical protein
MLFDKNCFYRLYNMKNGSVQGWFGVADTLLHCMILTYTVWLARKKKMIIRGESAQVMTLIDDALLILKLKDRST